ncbi:hypothetical protein ACP275_04G132100 [Erythranthe tilingii]
MEVDPWEALDLDDSDIPSLLRPCKRLRSATQSAAAAAAAASAPANHPLPQLPSSQPPAKNHPELQLVQQPPPSTSRLRTIPGPAGAVQAAMLRKELDRQNHKISNYPDHNGDDFSGKHHSDGVISTQEYIRRAMEDTAEFDDDFTCEPWLSAVQFLRGDNGRVRSTPISSIKKCIEGGKVVQVVAVVKSCTPNGLGGLMVLLKDPTGTVGASVHHKVLSQTEFGKNLTVGAALILREVAIFAPARSAHYLNITLRNVVKVFCQNSGSTSKLNNSVYPIQYADPGIETYGKAKTTEKMPTMQNVTTKDIEKSQCTSKIIDSQNLSVTQRQNIFTGSVQSNNRSGVNASASKTGRINLSQDICGKIAEGIIRTGISSENRECVKKDSVEEIEGTNNMMTNSVTKGCVEEIEGTNEVVGTQKQPQILKGSLPQWTDQQLDELFADDEDAASLFS